MYMDADPAVENMEVEHDNDGSQEIRSPTLSSFLCTRVSLERPGERLHWLVARSKHVGSSKSFEWADVEVYAQS